MNLLLDSHAMLWFVSGDRQLSSKARTLIESSDSVSHISMASWWEISIKHSLGKIELQSGLDSFMQTRAREGYRVLPIELEHLVAVNLLPYHHLDPFDRLMIAQAMSEKMILISSDKEFTKYDVSVVW